jgi:hypothetical protein
MNSNILPRILRIGISIFALLTVAAGISFILTGQGTTTVFAQQDAFLNNRINQIERQFNSIEMRINRLEQQPRLSSVTPQTSLNRDIEINQMRSQIQALQLRIVEVECSLLRVDERTLTTAARQARRKTISNETDRCRLNSNVPLQLSAHP